MTVYHVTHPAISVFRFSECQGAIECSGFLRKYCYFLQFFDHLRVPELIIKGVESLNLVSDEELFTGTVNGGENVCFA